MLECRYHDNGIHVLSFITNECKLIKDHLVTEKYHAVDFYTVLYTDERCLHPACLSHLLLCGFLHLLTEDYENLYMYDMVWAFELCAVLFFCFKRSRLGISVLSAPSF